MSWLFFGNLAFGVATGLLTGMSTSPVVSAVLPLMFTFAGGATLGLTTLRFRSDANAQGVTGIQLFAFAVGTIVGVLWGINVGGLPYQRP